MWPLWELIIIIIILKHALIIGFEINRHKLSGWWIAR